MDVITYKTMLVKEPHVITIWMLAQANFQLIQITITKYLNGVVWSESSP